MFCLYQWVTVALSAGRLVWIWAAGPATCRGAAGGACCGACALATVVMSANRMEADASLFTDVSSGEGCELLPQGNVTAGPRFPVGPLRRRCASMCGPVDFHAEAGAAAPMLHALSPPRAVPGLNYVG